MAPPPPSPPFPPPLLEHRSGRAGRTRAGASAPRPHGLDQLVGEPRRAAPRGGRLGDQAVVARHALRLVVAHAVGDQLDLVREVVVHDAVAELGVVGDLAQAWCGRSRARRASAGPTRRAGCGARRTCRRGATRVPRRAGAGSRLDGHVLGAGAGHGPAILTVGPGLLDKCQDFLDKCQERNRVVTAPSHGPARAPGVAR